jgi:putative transcriptional regulator
VTSPVSHHPDDDLLLAYAAGSLDEARSLLLAAHLSFCSHCRETVRRMEALGGAQLDALPESDLSRDAWAQLMRRLDAPPDPPAPVAGKSRGGLPAVLAPYFGAGRRTPRWRKFGPVEQAVLFKRGGLRARLLRIAPGTVMPRHGHAGQELTLVLDGAFSDDGAVYRQGDVTLADSEITHSPAVVGDTPCICLAVTDAPLRLSGLIGRLAGALLDL